MNHRDEVLGISFSIVVLWLGFMDFILELSVKSSSHELKPKNIFNLYSISVFTSMLSYSRVVLVINFQQNVLIAVVENGAARAKTG